MRRVIRFHSVYAGLTLALFLAEIAIALWCDDRLVRPYLGDTLAVLLVYCGARATTRMGVHAALLLALAAAVSVEFSQRFDLVGRIGLREYSVARTLFGTGFDCLDFVAYLLGGALALCCEAAAGHVFAARPCHSHPKRDRHS